MLVAVTQDRPEVRRDPLLPDHIGNKVSPIKQLVQNHLHVVGFVVVNAHPDRTILGEELPEQLQTRPHHPQPLGVLKIIVVVLEGRSGVVGWIDADAFHTAREMRQKRLQRLEVVALDKQVARLPVTAAEFRDFLDQAVRHPVRRSQIVVTGEPAERRHSGHMRTDGIVPASVMGRRDPVS